MSRMTFDKIVDFIMERLAVPAHDRRAMRDKVRKRVRYGLGDGSLPRIDVETMDVDRHELIYWARTKWPGKFDIPISVPAPLADKMSLAMNTEGIYLPADIGTCHALLRQQHLLLQQLDAECRAQESIIVDLRPDAEKYRKMREKNRESARKPRG